LDAASRSFPGGVNHAANCPKLSSGVSIREIDAALFQGTKSVSKPSEAKEWLVPLWRRAIVEARIKLVEPTLTDAQRAYLWEAIDSRELLIKLVAADYEAELEQIDREIEDELRNTA
jgi:hypothetical protein